MALMVGVAVAIFVGYGTAVGANVLVNKPQPIDANNSPTVARNPARVDNLVMVHRVDRPRYSARIEFSFDGGATWTPGSLPLPPGADRPYGPDVAFGSDGTLYVVYVNLEGVGNTPANVWLSRSSDGGRSLSDPVRVAGRLAFQVRLAVDGRGTIYLSWLQATEVGVLRLGQPPNPIVLSRSTDGGRTFSAPVVVSDPQRLRVGGASPVVDSAGRLEVLYEDFRDDRRDFENLDGPVSEQPFSLVMARSDDGGGSFARGVVVEPGVVPTQRFVVFLPPAASVAAGPGNALYVAWADGRNGDADVLLRRSPDAGATWSAPVRVNDNRKGDGTSQYLPRVAVSPGGRVDVVFLDRRRDPANVNTDVYLASSHDQGRTFRNLVLTSHPFDSGIGPATPHGDRDLGDRLGLDSQGDATFAAWTDTRAASRDTGRQDIAAAAVRRLPVWPVLVWPAVAGVAAVGVLWLVSRSRAGPGRPWPGRPWPGRPWWHRPPPQREQTLTATTGKDLAHVQTRS
ncbi:MAG: glycoside hydrolase [Actinomycetota bacterium]|nr:glycoside hydrolase [Actinomycetota bacterium]MDQ6947613.1 glycoside hydrolase [Actinomycetota bacterium]